MSVLPYDQKDRVAALAASGKTDGQIGDIFGCSRITVVSFRLKHGIAKKRGGNWHRKMVGKEIEPVEVYFDPAVNHMVKVIPPMEASGDLPADEEDYLW